MTSDEHLDELAALLALDALPADEQADAELRYGTFPPGLSQITLALAEGVAAIPPPDLRAATVTRALARRPAGAPARPPAPLSALECFSRTVDDVAAVLASLTAVEWDAPAHPGHGTVHALVAHLIGLDRLSRSWLDPDTTPLVAADVEHIQATRAVVADLAGTPHAELASVWLAGARAFALDAAAVDPSVEVSFHELVTTVDTLLLIRTFELWAHAMDVCAATGRPLPRLDPQRMTVLSARFMDFVPDAMAHGGTALSGRTARFVLIGESGGCYEVPLAPQTEAGRPDVTIVVDALDLCRLATGRLSPADLDAVIEGDAALGALVLANAGTLARD